MNKKIAILLFKVVKLSYIIISFTAEADYAFQLHKRIIPLMVEKNFIPDGWLGLLLGSKLRLDFTNLETIESDVNTLVKHLGSTTVEKEHNQDDIPSASGATLREKGDQRMGVCLYLFCFSRTSFGCFHCSSVN